MTTLTALLKEQFSTVEFIQIVLSRTVPTAEVLTRTEINNAKEWLPFLFQYQIQSHHVNKTKNGIVLIILVE